eukprot:TRINITY_DN10391_c0_g1_i1.p1 TRINITY_DN10391_c0_g1~~TRINITY_DN10391_c0_g1_i1.p1  ORF type:complete len:308 (+),score=45.43 TRINITY_DN10391_c0_g1_i1:109-1032(+)
MSTDFFSLEEPLFDPQLMDFDGFSYGQQVENLSEKSEKSTNQSSSLYTNKESPEYLATHREADSHDEQVVIRKAIQKRRLDPIIDNNKVYIYEDDPTEYKKARKRVQNRESATRVRSKMKSHVGAIEDEVEKLRHENSELKVKIASISAENSLLKQQISFLERLVIMGKNGSGGGGKEEQLLLPMSTDGIPYRENNAGQGTKHYLFLGLFTAVLFIFGVTTGDSGNRNELKFRNSGTMSPQSVSDDLDRRQSTYQSNSTIGDTLWGYGRSFFTIILVFSYALYCVYILLQLYPKHAARLFRLKYKNL